MSINAQIIALISAAQAANLSVDDITDEIRVRWEAGGPVQLKLDEWGRHNIAGSKYLFLSPLPILLGISLTPKQLQNIQSNCGVDASGNEVPAAFLGFTDETPANQAVAYLAARRYEPSLRPGESPPVFQPRTFRSRFRTVDEAVAYVAANPWVQ